ESPEFEDGVQRLIQQINDLAKWFDDNWIERLDRTPDDGAPVKLLDETLTRFNAVLDALTLNYAYVNAFVTTDSRNTLAQAKLSTLQMHNVTLSKLGTRLTAWLGSLDVEALIDQSQIAREHAYTLRRAKIEAQHLMSPPEEDLAAE